jgi:hypothetical protein
MLLISVLKTTHLWEKENVIHKISYAVGGNGLYGTEEQRGKFVSAETVVLKGY